MNNKSKIITSKGKLYLTVVAFASLLVMAFNVNTNSMNVHAIDFGLISKDTNIGSIDTSSLFNCVGAAITCDNDNTVNNNIAINNGTNGNGGGGETPLPELFNCMDCLTFNLDGPQLTALAASLEIASTGNERLFDICEALSAAGTVEALIEILGEAGLSAEVIVDLLACFQIDVTLAEVELIIGL